MNRFRPNVTVAAVVRCDNRYLVVEEEKGGRRVFNQPAGHLEANETIEAAMARELWEETGQRLTPTELIAIDQDQGQDDPHILRFTYALELTGPCPPPQPVDSDILAAHWLTIDELQARRDAWRSPMVGRSIEDFLEGTRYPPDVIRQVSRR